MMLLMLLFVHPALFLFVVILLSATPFPDS
jgi:hypothetical protein